MSVDKLINLLAAITLIEMTITIGLGVEVSDVVAVGRKWSLVARALVANYLLVPAAALGLVVLFRADPMVAAGFMVVAVCPGAPYAPPFTAMAKGNVTMAVGLMVILAASSALLAPLLLGILLPMVARNAPLKINVLKMTATLLGAQLLPLCLGLWIRHRRPFVADKLKKPASALSLLLNILLLTTILVVQFRILLSVSLRGYFGMMLLLAACVLAGLLIASRESVEDTKGVVLTTSVRNVGVSLVIATASFPGTAAITSATAYAIFQTLIIALIAVAWGRLVPPVVITQRKAA